MYPFCCKWVLLCPIDPREPVGIFARSVRASLRNHICEGLIRQEITDVLITVITDGAYDTRALLDPSVRVGCEMSERWSDSAGQYIEETVSVNIRGFSSCQMNQCGQEMI